MVENTANELPVIDVAFRIHGQYLPADHGYLLYSAISRTLPVLHSATWLGLELISGLPAAQGLILLSEHGAFMHVRVPGERYRDVLPLAGKRLDIGRHQIRIGPPTAHPLQPASSLYARIVTIKNSTEAKPFLEAAHLKLESAGINARLELPLDDKGRFRRRIISIHGKAVVGFSLAAHELTDDDSLILQSQKIFSRRAMGCGIFRPIVTNSERRE